MCTHLFGLISFPSSNSYELSKTAFGNSNGYGTKFKLDKVYQQKQVSTVST